jgi:uncharacterized protein (UPF0548 family)
MGLRHFDTSHADLFHIHMQNEALLAVTVNREPVEGIAHQVLVKTTAGREQACGSPNSNPEKNDLR